jgi:hypothetical protein
MHGLSNGILDISKTKDCFGKIIAGHVTCMTSVLMFGDSMHHTNINFSPAFLWIRRPHSSQDTSRRTDTFQTCPEKQNN